MKHKIVAVGSRSTESAEAFIQKLKESKDDSQWGVENGVLDGVKGYGSYEEVYNDPVRDLSIFLHHDHLQSCWPCSARFGGGNKRGLRRTDRPNRIVETTSG